MSNAVLMRCQVYPIRLSELFLEGHGLMISESMSSGFVLAKIEGCSIDSPRQESVPR